jgi:arsenate reductase (thioredoxin)
MSTKAKPIVLIVSTTNSCRSQMAEGILKHTSGDLLEVISAGSKPSGFIHPKALDVMKEIGIDLSLHRSKHLDEFKDKKAHTLITMCPKAESHCSSFTVTSRRLQWYYEDPALARGTFADETKTFRITRDQIKKDVEDFALQFKGTEVPLS